MLTVDAHITSNSQGLAIYIIVKSTKNNKAALGHESLKQAETVPSIFGRE